MANSISSFMTYPIPNRAKFKRKSSKYIFSCLRCHHHRRSSTTRHPHTFCETLYFIATNFYDQASAIWPQIDDCVNSWISLSSFLINRISWFDKILLISFMCVSKEKEKIKRSLNNDFWLIYNHRNVAQLVDVLSIVHEKRRNKILVGLTRIFVYRIFCTILLEQRFVNRLWAL